MLFLLGAAPLVLRLVVSVTLNPMYVAVAAAVISRFIRRAHAPRITANCSHTTPLLHRHMATIVIVGLNCIFTATLACMTVILLVITFRCIIASMTKQ